MVSRFMGFEVREMDEYYYQVAEAMMDEAIRRNDPESEDNKDTDRINRGMAHLARMFR